jgi:hypothetical protein
VLTGFQFETNTARRALLSLILLCVVTAAGITSAAAEPEQATASEPRTADDEFSKQLSDLKRTFADLSKKFEASAQTIDRLSSAEDARKEMEELRDYVSKLLGAVADNGTVWTLGSKALKHAEDKLKSLELETRFKPEDRLVPDRAVARAQDSDRSGDQGARRRPQGFCRAPAQAADE